ncbi:MAG: hypothetical protein ABI414_12550, partial [Devosia sp.]
KDLVARSGLWASHPVTKARVEAMRELIADEKLDKKALVAARYSRSSSYRSVAMCGLRPRTRLTIPLFLTPSQLPRLEPDHHDKDAKRRHLPLREACHHVASRQIGCERWGRRHRACSNADWPSSARPVLMVIRNCRRKHPYHR